MKYIMALGHGVVVRKREPLMAIMAEAEARSIIMNSAARGRTIRRLLKGTSAKSSRSA